RTAQTAPTNAAASETASQRDLRGGTSQTWTIPSRRATTNLELSGENSHLARRRLPIRPRSCFVVVSKKATCTDSLFPSQTSDSHFQRGDHFGSVRRDDSGLSSTANHRPSGEACWI